MHSLVHGVARLNVADLPETPVEVFYSYAHEDERLRIALEKHLTLLKRQGVITGWHDRRISAGTEWAGQIDSHLNTAALILLLVSPDFLGSDYCYDVELARALQRHEAGEARVIPIILRPVDWMSGSFGKLQALPSNGKPVTTWGNRDQAFFNVATGIRAAIEELRSKSTAISQKRAAESPQRSSIKERQSRKPAVAARERSSAKLSSTLESNQIVGNYRIGTQIAVGSLSEVYRATHMSLNREFTLKLLKPNVVDSLLWTKDLRAAFIERLGIFLRIKHPNVIRVTSCDEYRGLVYVISESVNGDMLGEMLGKRIPIQYCIDLLHEIAEGVDYIHSNGLIRLDLKPSQILVQTDWTAKISLSFLSILAAFAQPDAIMGTPGYMAPEVLLAGQVGPAADQYALGIMAYQLFAGRLPFELDWQIHSKQDVERLLQKMKNPPPSLGTLRPELGTKAADTVFTRVLDVAPVERFANATGFVSALARALKVDG